MKKLIIVLLLFAMLSISVEAANPHPITYEKGRSLNINDYDVESIKYNGPFWNPDLNVMAFNMGGEGRLLGSKQGIDPVVYYYPAYPYYNYYSTRYPMRFDYPYGYQRFYGYNYQRNPAFNNCVRTIVNQGFYSTTYDDCGQSHWQY